MSEFRRQRNGDQLSALMYSKLGDILKAQGEYFAARELEEMVFWEQMDEKAWDFLDHDAF